MSTTVAGSGLGRPPDSDTERLASAAAEGSLDALGQLYERYVDLTYRFIAVRVGDQATAEDVTSELWMRVSRVIRGYRTIGSGFSAWLLTLASRLVADHYRKPVIKRETPTADMLALDPVSAGESPEDAAIRSDAAAMVVRALQHLSTRQRECVTLRFFVGLSVAETAEAMGRGEGSVKVLQHRALRKLATVLNGATSARTANLSPSGSVTWVTNAADGASAVESEERAP